jgi:sugar lactone lactonase YvrE
MGALRLRRCAGTLAIVVGVAAAPFGVSARGADLAPSYGFAGDGGLATEARLAAPSAVAMTEDGGFLVADTDNHRIRKVAPDATITTVAGNGLAAFAGDNGPATEASLASPTDVAVIPGGGFLVADTGNGRIRRVTPEGTIETVAAQLHAPQGVDINAARTILISDTGSNRVLALAEGSGLMTVAGNGAEGAGGDGHTATLASLNHPVDVVWSLSGGFYIADTGNSRVREVNSAGIIDTVAGTGNAGYTGDDVGADDSGLSFASGLSLESEGSLLIADTHNQRIRRLQPFGGIDTVAGVGRALDIPIPDPGDDEYAVEAQLSYPRAVASTGGDGFLIADTAADRIREVRQDGTIVDVAGSGRPHVFLRATGTNASGSRNLYLNPWRFALEKTKLTIHRGERLVLCLLSNLAADLKIAVTHGAQTVHEAKLRIGSAGSLICPKVTIKHVKRGRQYRVKVTATHRGEQSAKDALKLIVT